MDATPKAANGLTYWAARGVYRKVVGGRCFYFGSDPHAAAAEAAAITSQWRRFKAEGHQTWPRGEPDRQSIRRALGLGIGTSLTLQTGQAVDQPAPVRDAAELVSARSITVDQAANLYMDEQRKADVGERWVKDISFRLGRAIDVLGRTKPMNTIGQSELVDFAAFWRKRPPKIGQKARAKSQVSVLYASRVVAAMKSFLAWAADHPDIAWPRPPRFDALLLIRTNRPTTSAEKEVIKARVLGESQRYFTIDELQKVFRVADPAMQAFILLGLNCAYSSSEIANLKVTDLKHDGSPRIETVRHKTIGREHPVPSKHFLWPETYARIMAAKAKTNKDSYMFLSHTGKPLVSAKYNAFPHAWDAVREEAGLKHVLSFKHLRKTSANEMRKLAGMEIADVHLAHGEKLKMIGPYTDRLWDQHKQATNQLRGVFKKVWS